LDEIFSYSPNLCIANINYNFFSSLLVILECIDTLLAFDPYKVCLPKTVEKS